MKNVRIKVLKMVFHEDLALEYHTDGADTKCGYYKEGDEFIYNRPGEMPEGFCPWAWHDIWPSVNMISLGGSCAPWINREGATVVCCQDGVRPVVFLVERAG